MRSARDSRRPRRPRQGFDCGILINSGIAVHKGTAYLFGFSDPAVHAATDPADRATCLELLGSVRFPE